MTERVVVISKISFVSIFGRIEIQKKVGGKGAVAPPCSPQKRH